MEERAIHISSVKREKRGTSIPGDFTIKFNPPLKLDPEMKHKLALDRLSMTYFCTTLEVITKTIKSNTVMTKASRGKQLLSQMVCIPTQISTIIFISTWLKKKSLNRLKWKKSVFNKFHFYFISLSSFNFN